VRPGWREGLNIFIVTVAASGERKSAVQAVLTRPLRDQEAVMAAEGAQLRSEAETMHHIAVKAADQAKADASRAESAEKDRLLAEAVAAQAMADSLKVPAIPRILADDITGEAVASLLADQGGRLAVISAEGGIFDVIAGRYSHNIPVPHVWLKGYSGDPLRVDRKGRPSEYVPRPALTVGLMIQPDVLATIGRNGAFRGRGLLARNLYCLPETKVGRRSAHARPIPDDIAAKYAAVIASLAADFHGWTDPAILRLDEHAAHGVTALLESIEPQLAGTGAARRPR
jgi:replicative DNA helicase